ncbi:MAG: amino acid ABC transporter substrate-binding protein [Selenomonadaceae bacterium]|nr:amino acid ABC transporter substrate-binding protein [Selenomonadaceae bacterium]
MKIKGLVLTALLAATTVITGCGGDANSNGAGGSNSGKIVVGLDDEFPPMGFRDDKNEITGFDVDLAKEAASRLGRDVEFKAIDWSSKEAELKSKRIDVLWNGLDITPERQENMLFSAPYMDNRQIVFVRHTESPSTINSEADLAGKIVGTQSASTAEDYFNKNEGLKSSFAELKTYSDFTSAFMDLENGRIDAVVGDEIVGRYYMSKIVFRDLEKGNIDAVAKDENAGVSQQPEKIVALDVVIGPVSQFGIAFRKDDTNLRDEVQKVFDEMVKDGTAKKISEQWFGKDLIKSKYQ